MMRYERSQLLCDRQAWQVKFKTMLPIQRLARTVGKINFKCLLYLTLSRGRTGRFRGQGDSRGMYYYYYCYCIVIVTRLLRGGGGGAVHVADDLWGRVRYIDFRATGNTACRRVTSRRFPGRLRGCPLRRGWIESGWLSRQWVAQGATSGGGG